MASVHDKLNRVRKPRVHITYDVETEGAAIDFVRDAFGHLKTIAVDKGGRALRLGDVALPIPPPQAPKRPGRTRRAQALH